MLHAEVTIPKLVYMRGSSPAIARPPSAFKQTASATLAIHHKHLKSGFGIVPSFVVDLFRRVERQQQLFPAGGSVGEKELRR
jgi:hypothetical protein